MTSQTSSGSPRPVGSSSGPAPDLPALVVGVDAGGTTTRALVATLAGRRLGEVRTAGANPNSHGAERAAGRLTEAVGSALDQAGPGAREAVADCVVGLAGVSALRDGGVRARMQRSLSEAGLPSWAGVFTGDDAVAFASGTPLPHGTVLIAGTGAIASRVDDRERSRSADGLGWLIGDEGSGFWIGWRAARETAAQLSLGGELGPLAQEVAAQVFPEGRGAEAAAGEEGTALPEEHARTFARILTGEAPVALARFAPLASDAYEHDPAARQIVDAAAGHLARSVRQVRPAHREDSPVVLAGGMLDHSAPLRRALTRELASDTAGADVVTAGCTTGAAAWLAALRAGAAEDDRALHTAFTVTGTDTAG